MMQMLAAGGMPILSDGLRRPDQDNSRGYFELEAVKRTKLDASWIAQAEGKAVKVIHLLIPELPLDRRYAVILMNRSLDEVVASQRKMLERFGEAGGALNDAQFAQTFARQLDAVRRHMSDSAAFRCLEIDYAECVESPSTAASKVNTFLGGRLDESRIAAAVDPTLWRNRSAP
jgi:hypothetical protein